MSLILFWTLLWFLGIGIFLYLMLRLIRWTTIRLSQRVEANVRAAECIVNEERVPDGWIESYQSKIDAVRHNGGSESEIEHIGQREYARCLRQLDDLIKFFNESNMVDSIESRHILINSLQNQRDRWAAIGWRGLLET
ncbi:hypothetical protein KFU94_23035 [Chloroflexi bacterium TSY]|nr:hypothetical protein [Chloroflexi bacterium TSY]